MASRLLLLRHAHTEPADPAGRPTLSGWHDVPLSPLGREQAEQVGRALAPAEFPGGVYASPLRRTLETIAPLATRHGLPVRACAGLREISCGELEGWTVAAVRERFPELWRSNEAAIDPDLRWPGGESYRELRQRAFDTLEGLARAHAEESVLLVTHAGVIAQVVGALQGRGAEDWRTFRPGHCSVSEVSWNGRGWTLERYDDRSLLGGDDGPADARP